MATSKSLSADELRFCSLPAGRKSGHQNSIQALHPSCWDVHFVEVKHCDHHDETRPE